MIKNLKKLILEGKIFIYPTDTIYGLGCDALNENSVAKIREIKNRDNKPFSVIAPSFEWIEDNCIIDCDIKKYLPGPYTLILKKKNPELLKHISDTDKIGVRIPATDFTKKIQKAGVPFVTTSVNISGGKFANEIGEISKEIIDKVDFVIDDDKLSGKPSTLVIDGKEIER